MHVAGPARFLGRKKNVENQPSCGYTLAATTWLRCGDPPATFVASMFRMKSAHALLQWEGGIPEAWTQVCVHGTETSTATRTSPRKAAVWAKPTVSISAGRSAGLKKQEKWPENTETEPSRSQERNETGRRNRHQASRVFRGTRETPVCVSFARLASIKNVRIASGQNRSNNACSI